MLRRAPLRPLLTSDPIMQRRALLRLPLALSLALTLTQTLSGCSEEKAAATLPFEARAATVTGESTVRLPRLSVLPLRFNVFDVLL